MNFADEDATFTRIHEPKHFHLERTFSNIDPDQPYYPVNLASDRDMYNKYAALQEELPSVIFGGRLARYKYYDMHQVIAGALAVARKRLKGIEE